MKYYEAITHELIIRSQIKLAKKKYFFFSSN